MLIGLLFWLLLMISCGHATVFGGREGRRAAVLLVSASLLTVGAAALGRGWGAFEELRFLVDLALLLGLYALMVSARRCWPVWMTGFHLVGVVTHVGVVIAPDFVPEIYRALQSVWAIPVLLSLLIGVEMDRRAGVATGRDG